MSYKKTNWQNGITPLNAKNMNHIEEGIYNNNLNNDLTNQMIESVNTQVQRLSNQIVAMSSKLPKLIILSEED